jgi:signal transduction histidine kinase/ligand-binding sensor domain-containing protein/DNA-binding response OmpR family regulator
MKNKPLTILISIALLLLGGLTTSLHAKSGIIYGTDKLSSSRTLCVVQDKYGFIWIGTENGLNCYDGYHFRSYTHSAKDPRSLCGIDVITMLVSKNHELWIGTGSGVCRYNYATDDFEKIALPIHEKIHISCLYEKSDGGILIGTAGFGVFEYKNGKMSRYLKEAKVDGASFVNALMVDNSGRLWTSSYMPIAISYRKSRKGTSSKVYPTSKGQVIDYVKTADDNLLVLCTNGILRYDKKTDRFVDAGFDLTAMKGAPIRCVSKTNRGDIYIGSRGHGVFVIYKGTRKAVPVVLNQMPVMSKSTVNNVCEDRQGNLWISCYQTGVYKLSVHNDVFGFWTVEDEGMPQGSLLSAIAPYHDGLLGAVFNDGIYAFNRLGNIVNNGGEGMTVNSMVCDDKGRYWACGGKQIWQYTPIGQYRQVFSNSNFETAHLAVDSKNDKLYFNLIGNALGILDLKTMHTRLITIEGKGRDRLNNCWIQHIMIDRQGLVWVSTADGVSCYDPRKDSFLRYGWTNILKHHLVYATCEDRVGNIIIGCNDGLFYFNRKTNRVGRMNESEELEDLQIYSIIIDKHGDPWLSTSRGIWHYDEKVKTFESFLQGNGLEANQYIQDAAVTLKDGRLAFGTDKGAVVFDPDLLKMGHKDKAPVYLVRFMVDDKALDFRENKFNVPAGSNGFTFELSTLDYNHPEHVTYQYRMDKDSLWNSAIEGNNSFTFNKMRPGAYTIEVRALINGQYSAVKTFEIYVEAPWYASTMAKVFYLLICVCIVLGFYRYKQRRLQIDYEEQKMKFLINATHDIRSPLTLIMGPLTKLKSLVTDDEGKRYINIIERNAERMLMLVNQILDVRKIDMKQMQIHCASTDMVQLCKGIVSLYQYHAIERNISLIVHSNNPQVEVWVDRVNFEKVVSNLLSNAVKYTFDGGEVVIDIEQQEKNVVISIEDNGVGMEDSEYSLIFDRFYQGTNSRGYHVGGTGIGLNLCKQLVEMHHGTIKAGSRADGQRGTRFTITLLRGCDHLTEEQIEKQSVETKPMGKGVSHRDCKILVADDDVEIARYVKTELGAWYSVNVVNNGRDALTALLNDNYDLLVSDVMMPEMDGITLLKSVKQNPNISDVPVILLTSKAEVEDRLHGLECGADAFIAKPFSINELHITIDNLINNIRRLRGKFSGMQTQDAKIDNVEMTDNDKVLMDRITESVNAHYTDSRYGVEQLANDIGLSRVQLHRKMKQITGIATSDFIRNIRLKQAARLIRENKVNISQIAYAVGFNSLPHFSTLFKKYYGMSPSEYAEKAKKQE